MNSPNAPLDLYANAECAILITNSGGTVVWANRRASELTGYAREELCGHAVSDLIPGITTRGKRGGGSEGDALAGAVRFESVLRDCDGGGIDVAVFTRPVEWNGEASAVLIRARDIRREADLRKRLRSEVRRAALLQERERKRIARIVHDEILSGLLDLAMQLPTPAPGDDSPEMVLDRDAVELLRGQLDSSIRSVRLLASRLREDKPEDVDFVASLSALARGQSPDAPAIEVTVLGDPVKVTREAGYLLLGAVQEALRNVERHSRATSANVRLTFARDRLELEIEDNGVGFDAPQDEHVATSRGALGLLGLYERATLLEGTLHIASSHTAGTCVRLRVPLSSVCDD